MGERAKIMLNEYTAKALLKRDDLDLDKFYSTDIKMMVKVAQQELKKKDSIINELENTIENFMKNHTEGYLDWKYDREIYLAESNVLQKLYDTYFDKLKALKENNNE